ncbi:hypothetical protein [Streptomyces sp. NRRL S-455]|uniref:hypothetical protein n=1 Tax=Streptomyces sp. NRRL S-455 TaxID=1463908 RepID=UPI000A7553CD|nr:hypothetical protein [Streptomyces sp. NRRL S-455]
MGVDTMGVPQPRGTGFEARDLTPDTTGARHEGLHDDLPRYLNQDLLLHLWPVLRTLVGRTVRTVWEEPFPQLASRTRAAA